MNKCIKIISENKDILFKDVNDCIVKIIEIYKDGDNSIEDVLRDICIIGLSSFDVSNIYAKVVYEIEGDETIQFNTEEGTSIRKGEEAAYVISR